MAGPALTDVPDRYDVVFQLNNGNTYGFLLADSVESNLPFRTHKALYSYSPTFLERQNVSQQYGDNFQDFFLTGSQDDFSLGEQQKFFRVNDANRVRRYWSGFNVDPVTDPGTVVLTSSLLSASPAASSAWCPSPIVISTQFGYSWLGADGTNLYGMTASSGAIVTKGAHGLGASTGSTYISVDQANVYISSEGSGSVGIRKWNGLTFSTFSATTVSQTTYVNNILFGVQTTTDSLMSFDTSGSPTTQFQWKNADGTQSQSSFIKMIPHGGSIYIIRKNIQTELWMYDGSGCRMLANFPDDFVGKDITVVQGIVFVAGGSALSPGSYRPQVYYYSNGSVGMLWQSAVSATTNGGAVCPFGSGVAFQDTSTNHLLLYDLALGGTHTVADLGVSPVALSTSDWTSAILAVGSSSNIFNATGNYNSTGHIQTSQYDFDNTLNKVMRAIKVDADIPANTSVDIAYQLDGCGGTYTTLATGITSGTEYLLPASTSAHSISVQITLNSATGSATPTLKRVYVRAAPTLQQFRRREFLFDLSGGLREEIGKSARRNRDNTPYPYDPKTAANNLRTIATQTIPFTVQDRFDQFTCIADLQQNQEGYDGFAIYEIRPDVFIGRINLREV